MLQRLHLLKIETSGALDSHHPAEISIFKEPFLIRS
jgi:hypothetical protein